jgi:hypothetical protein
MMGLLGVVAALSLQIFRRVRSPYHPPKIRGMIELKFLAALQAVVDGFDSHILHQIYIAS